ncbi:MAG: PAS/PAC sensor signal transduction histidine kinase [Methanolobus sp. T82-4]|nr:MAG: PAS/PAC sensor signal transduction histidine kinase [Methanolobus sp. T82-4]
MKGKTLTFKKQTLQEKVSRDAILVVVIGMFLFFVSSLAGISRILIEEPDLFVRFRIGELSIILMFLLIISLIFSRRRYLELRDSYDNFDSVERMKDEFISNLRHELKTPLIPIKGYSELMHEEDLGCINEKQKDALCKILDSCERLLHRIDSLIFMSIASSGDIEYSFSHLRLEDVIDGAISSLNPEISRKQQLIEKDIEKELPFIYGDRAYLKEVFVQILDNAIKFSPEQSSIQICAYEGYKSLHVKITDKGSGIPEEEIENVFERFYQTDGSITRKYNGNGLGLYVARSIVKAHHGNIWIESEEGKGTTVHVKLPETDMNFQKTTGIYPVS